MLLAIEVTVNLLWIGLAMAGSLFIGFWFRSAQLEKLKNRILELEKEMLQNHAEILSLQRENISIQNTIRDKSVPVIPMTSKDANPEPIPDVNLRKKLLGKKHS